MTAFDDMVSADLGCLIDDGSELGADAVCVAAEGGKQVSIRLAWGDDANGLQSVSEGTTTNLTAPAMTRRSIIATAFGREVQVGDLIQIATGAKAGEWVIAAPPQLDDGDGANLSLRRERMLSAGRFSK